MLDIFYSWKAHAHYFTVSIYLATWRAAELCIFTHFMFTNLPRCNNSLNSLIYIYILYTDPQLLLISSWSQSWSYFFLLMPPKKKFFITSWKHLITCAYLFTCITFLALSFLIAIFYPLHSYSTPPSLVTLFSMCGKKDPFYQFCPCHFYKCRN